MRFVLLAFILLVIGCSGPTRTYDVTVRNDLNQPITVWLTKNGPPIEEKWLSPEQIAMGQAPTGRQWVGVDVPSGKTAETGKIKGKFPDGTSAVLRIYLGQHTLDELLAMSRTGRSRIDIVLPPGESNLVVREQDGMMVADPAPGKL